MRNHTIYIFLLALLVPCGCKESMDIQRDDRVEDMKSVYQRLSRLYEHLRLTNYAPTETGPSTGFTAGGHMAAVYCDEAQEVSQVSPVYKWYKGSVSSSDMPLWTNSENGGTHRWDGLFNSIYDCNEAIKYLSAPDLVTDYREAQRVRCLSQFYAIRAYAYLQIIKRFGGIPIIREALGRDHDWSKDERASFAQCVDFIIESCDLAMEADPSLPWFNGSPNYSNPEIARCGLWSIKAQAALYAASPLWAEDYSGTEKYTWERAAAITKSALDLAIGHGAKLVDASTSFPIESDAGLIAYDKYFLSPYPWTLSWDTETMMQPFNYGNRQALVWQYSGIPVDEGQVSAGACPTQEMVDAYEVLSADGVVSEPLLDLANPYNPDGTPNFNPAAIALGYEDCSAGMYENRDPRFYSTIYYDGAKIILPDEGEFEIQTHEGGNCGIDLSPSNMKNTCTGYYLRKFSNPRSGTEAGNKDGYMRTFRLAELYLNFAEAAFNAYGPDTDCAATTATEPDLDGNPVTVVHGTPMSARSAVNTVRARVGMPAISDNGTAFGLRLKNERRVELAFEEHRFFDVRRWTSPDGDLSATDARVGGIRIEKNGVNKTYSRFYFPRNCFANKYLKYPISLDEVRKMQAHTGRNWQNPGWD